MSKSVATVQTFISEGTQILGDIKVEHDLRVDGFLKGTVDQVKVRSATVAGQILGNLHAQEKIVLEPKSTLVGDLQTRELVINEGAVFQGNCSMQMDEKR